MSDISGMIDLRHFEEDNRMGSKGEEEKYMDKKDVHGLRFNKGKLKWSYVHFGSLEPMVRVLEYGANKYAPFNWQKGLDKMEILESMQRHLAAMMDGEETDPESGLPHIGHVMCNTMFWSYMDLKDKGLLEKNNNKDD